MHTRMSRRVRVILSLFSLIGYLYTTGPLSLIYAQTADVTVSIDLNTQIGTSDFANGFTEVDTSLLYPWGSNNQTAVNNALRLIKEGITYHNVHLMAWGAPDPWPDPAQSEPTNWGTLDRQMKMIVDAGSIPVLTLCEAPWWMKGQLQGGGSTKLLTKADEWADIAYSSRVLDNKMDKWLLLIQRAAERYMSAPYNVRYFQVWNEFKGYHNPTLNRWDYENSAGDPSGNNAKHGYTYMYNEAYKRLKQVAHAKGIPESEIKIGGPYVVMSSYKDKNFSHPSSVSGSWGVLDRRPMDAITYWLQNKAGAEFITVDGKNTGKDGVHVTDQFTSVEKFAAVQDWIRAQPGGGSLPLWWAEWYVIPYEGTTTDALRNALTSYATMQVITHRGSTPLQWGGGNMWTSTVVGGGQPKPWYFSVKSFDDAFSKGTAIYKASSSSTEVAVMASRTKTVLINKSGSRTHTVSVNGTSVTLAPYAVSFINTPGGTTVTSTPTRTPTRIPTGATATPSRTPSASATSTPPSSTATPTRAVSPTPTSASGSCSRKQSGDATCDGVIDITDFELFRREFTGESSTKAADFDGDGAVSITDFEIWRNGYFGEGA